MQFLLQDQVDSDRYPVLVSCGSIQGVQALRLLKEAHRHLKWHLNLQETDDNTTGPYSEDALIHAGDIYGSQCLSAWTTHPSGKKNGRKRIRVLGVDTWSLKQSAQGWCGSWAFPGTETLSASKRLTAAPSRTAGRELVFQSHKADGGELLSSSGYTLLQKVTLSPKQKWVDGRKCWLALPHSRAHRGLQYY